MLDVGPIEVNKRDGLFHGDSSGETDVKYII